MSAPGDPAATPEPASTPEPVATPEPAATLDPASALDPASTPGHPRPAPAPAPGRVLITGPRTRAARRPRYPVTREIDEQTGLGEAYMRSLVQTQLRLAVRLCLVLAVVVFGLPALFALFPGLREQRLLGVPVAWLVLAGLIYPWFVLCGWWYVRHAERNERDFAELVDRAPGEDR